MRLWVLSSLLSLTILPACSLYQSEARKVLENQGLNIASVAATTKEIPTECEVVAPDHVEELQQLQPHDDGTQPVVYLDQETGLYHLCP